MKTPSLVLILLGLVLAQLSDAQQRRRPGGRVPLEVQEKRAIEEGFRGVTADGKVIPGLFKVKSTGVSTAPVREAADQFLASLSKSQRAATLFKVDDDEWRKWANQHHYKRQGVSFADMDKKQRELAFGLLDSALSARGLKTTRDIMRLNETLAEFKKNWDEYGEWLYHITVMGEPSGKQPWGWQLDGHHVVINYFVLGDQVVMSPVFIGSEPVKAEWGKYKGTVVMQKEQDTGLAFLRSLPQEQRKAATVQGEKGPTNSLAEAFKDNLIAENIGISAKNLNKAGREGLMQLIAVFINHMEKDHASVRLAEIREHLDATYFAWIGGNADDSVFYYRIQSPVIYIEFDHQRPIGLARDRVPTRNHIHAVIRTPNGNDYGKDLLRQHYKADHSK
ncbi:MAG: DUF3500 domain-containing protein [Verrucomicrobiaceae bacterium]|nr:DUF3500 domain-containing protein [Verrucomicrobiaceae bacterium]